MYIRVCIEIINNLIKELKTGLIVAPDFVYTWAFFILPHPMSTVFNRISEYEKYSNFRFNAKGRNVVGMMTAREWRERYNHELFFTQSIEPDGTFTVYDYPDYFNEVIDNTIHTYVKKCISKRTNEKPLIKSQPNSISYSSKPTSPPKKRTRKPIQAPPQPAFSGKKLINKK